MTHHYHYKSSIPPEVVDRQAERRGFESRSEYLRALLREDIPEGELAQTDGGNIL